MKPTFKEKLRYRFEQFLSKGGSSIFLSLLIVFLVAFTVIAGLRVLLINIFPALNYTDNVFTDIWYTFLEMTSTGSMQKDTDSPAFLKIMTILAGLVGVVLLSMLIAFITTSLNKLLYEFRKGRGRVIESGHTLIFGWNERIVDVIRELIIANESESDAAVVILSNEEKEAMDDLITKRLPNTETTRIITTQGDFANLSEHTRVNIQEAKSIIILAGCSESATQSDKIDSDVQALKSILAIISGREGEEEIPIIAEVFTDEKRNLISFFNYDNIITLDSWEIMGKLLIQTSLTSGLDAVYNEMLSFDGGEVYFTEGDWAGLSFYDLVYRFKDGIPMGVYNEADGLILRPDEDRKMKAEDQVVIFAEDDSTINFEPASFISSNDLPYTEVRMEQTQRRVLIMGWHRVANIYIDEAADYLKEDSVIDIMFKEPSQDLIDRVQEMKEEYDDFNINLKNTDTLSIEAIREMNPFSYDNIIILSQYGEEMSADKIDSDTLVILLILRKLKEEAENANSKIITQVLNSENQDIILQTNVDDFIISNKLITMILAQLSEEPLIKVLYDDLFSEEGSEIYVKPAHLYFDDFPQNIRFIDIINQAVKREEICLGFRLGSLSGDADANFGVKLNPAKDEMITLTQADFLVVLSEDEL
jgi:hypothetical protein